ncbi:MAG: TIGR02266 family protein [Myxococcales bacterium]|nr:TIGR02266 family protein [Myxococcales bacterium]
MVEKRRQRRAEAEIRVEYRTVGSFLSDYVTNISRGGVFVRTDTPLRIGTRVRLVFSLPGMPFPFDLNGEVRWVQERPNREHPERGMGIAFDGIDERIQKRIQAYVEKHSPAQGEPSEVHAFGAAAARHDITQKVIIPERPRQSR